MDLLFEFQNQNKPWIPKTQIKITKNLPKTQIKITKNLKIKPKM